MISKEYQKQKSNQNKKQKAHLFHFCILVKQYKQLTYKNIPTKNIKKIRQSRLTLERIPYI